MSALNEPISSQHRYFSINTAHEFLLVELFGAVIRINLDQQDDGEEDESQQQRETGEQGS